MTKLVLSTGQSNDLGRYEGGTAFSLATNVTAWNNVNPLGSNGTAFVTPTESSPPFNSTGGNNLALWFCRRMAQELNEAVELILVARDSSDLTYWNPTTGTIYQEIEDVHAATGRGAADVLIWHQGEGGNGATGEFDHLYKADWITMRNALRTAGILKNDAPSILGGLQGTRIGGARDMYLQELADENADVYYASSEGLTDGGDTLHFSGPALYTFGYFRYWEQYRKHIGPRASINGNLRISI